MIIASGAEALIDRADGVVVKQRVSKRYRLSEIDSRLRRERTRAEARIISAARRIGVPTPIIHDLEDFEIVMEYIDGKALRDEIDTGLSHETGRVVGLLHSGGIIHGDLTTSNIIYHREKIYLIDFGLAFFDTSTEARGVDIHVFFQTLRSGHEEAEEFASAFGEGYRAVFDDSCEVLSRVKEIARRGRYM
ncbi:Kae1-associated kinase Bud32 [Methanosarcinales archaeon ex4572_44]|nr:MAG: Kae1-associated kinase Bud32 [Methanosarcinales archaeon ex4484_138]PHP45719.1 MAG: Kae1-associated kinase Bud32 [Methanosarcinales archaeon ex4572_44]RLG24666.1 MAG: Kae1-associated kinase Bud32 [Methanosarcinales archaeon]HHI30797.1 Kae1-associated kinase Bud32 [Candidatus Methanoperedenaceae archaeon]